MQVLQNVDTGTALLLAIGCVFLCLMGLLVMFGLQIIGTGLNTITGVLQFFGNIINGGPGVWCGCLVLIIGCGGVALIAWVIASCHANPFAMNFCRLVP